MSNMNNHGVGTPDMTNPRDVAPWEVTVDFQSDLGPARLIAFFNAWLGRGMFIMMRQTETHYILRSQVLTVTREEIETRLQTWTRNVVLPAGDSNSITQSTSTDGRGKVDRSSSLKMGDKGKHISRSTKGRGFASFFSPFSRSTGETQPEEESDEEETYTFLSSSSVIKGHEEKDEELKVFPCLKEVNRLDVKSEMSSSEAALGSLIGGGDSGR